MKTILLAIVAACVAAMMFGIGGTPAEATNDKVTICHVAGRADNPANYITLTLSHNAVFKDQGGHFFENGTPQAGHEQDTLGECEPPTETTQPPAETTEPPVCEDCGIDTVVITTPTTVPGSTFPPESPPLTPPEESTTTVTTEPQPSFPIPTDLQPAGEVTTTIAGSPTLPSTGADDPGTLAAIAALVLAGGSGLGLLARRRS